MASSSRPRELFLSHSSKDRGFASRLSRVLQAQRVPVWYSSTRIVGAQQWHDEIGAALARCDWFVVVLSPDSVASEWVKRELLYVLNRRQYRDRIVPVVYRTCDWSPLSWTLDQIQMIDFRRAFQRGCSELLRIWGLTPDPGRPPGSRGATPRRRNRGR